MQQITLPAAAISWRRAGVVLPPFAVQSGWDRHCQMPTPLLLDNDILQIYYCTRDQRNRSHVFFADVAVDAPARVIALVPKNRACSRVLLAISMPRASCRQA